MLRTWEESNRRVQRIDVTEAGEALYRWLKHAAVGFDRTLRDAIDEHESDVDSFFGTLCRLAESVSDGGRGPVLEGLPGNRRGE